MLLSILTPSLTQRRDLLQRLGNRLRPQIDAMPGQIQWLVDTYDGNNEQRPSVGQASNLLMDKSIGDYVCRVDDDDLVASDYCAKIVEAMQFKPDCVIFGVKHCSDAGPAQDCQFDINCPKQGRTENTGGQNIGGKIVGGITRLIRYPNHLCPVRRDIIRRNGIKFPDADYGEDSAYSEQLRPHLRSVGLVAGPPIYFYEYNPVKDYKIRKSV